MTEYKEKTFKEWLKENPEKEEELKKYKFKIVSKPPKFCWGINLSTTLEEDWKIYKSGGVDIKSPKVKKQITPYGLKKNKEEKKVKELVEEIKNQVLKAKNEKKRTKESY